MANSLLDPEQQEAGSSGTSGDELEKIPTAPRPGSPNDYPGRKPYEQPNNVDVQDGEPTYDRPGNQPDQEKNDSKNPNSSFLRNPFRKNKEKDSPDRSELANQEKSGGQNTAGKAGGNTPDNERSFYNPSSKASGSSPTTKLLGKLLGTRKNKILGLGGATGIIILMIFGFTFIQGPLQLIHLSQILSKGFSNHQNASESRMRGIYKWARTGEVGYTRLTYLETKMIPIINDKLANQGIEVERGKYTGQLRNMTIDSSKNDQIRGLSDERAKAFIAEANGVSPDKVAKISGVAGPDGKSSKFRVSFSKENTNVKRAAVKKGMVGYAIESQSFNKATSWIQDRTFLKFIDAQSFLHPLHNKITKGKSFLENRKILSDIKKAREARINALSPEAKARVTSIKGKLGVGAGIVSGVLLGTSFICVAKDISGQVPDINRANVVIPAMRSSAELIAIGAQVQSGQDIDPAQLGAITEGLKDPKTGKTIWDSMALQAQATGNANNVLGGQDISPDIKQAFSPESSAANVEKALDEAGAGSLCSWGGQLFQGVVGAVLLLVPGPGWIVKGLSVAAGAAAMSAISTIVPKLIADEPLTGTPHEGPNGGNVDTYGARELANSSFRSSAASELTPAQSLVLKNQNDITDRQEFASKGIASRLFDVKDYRSVASKFIDQLNPNPTQNIAKLASSILNFKNLLSGFYSALMPKAFAASTTSYDFGFPEYGFSQDILDNPSYEDPFSNGDDVVNRILPAHQNDSPNFIERAQKCFGVNITQTKEGWDAVAVSDVNPSSNKYHEANCADTSPDWTQVRLFVLDSRTMEAYACYENDPTSCTNMGISNSSDSSSSTTNSGPGI